MMSESRRAPLCPVAYVAHQSTKGSSCFSVATPLKLRMESYGIVNQSSPSNQARTLLADTANKQKQYSDDTANLIARQLLDGATPETTIAAVSAPSVFIALKNAIVSSACFPVT